MSAIYYDVSRPRPNQCLPPHDFLFLDFFPHHSKRRSGETAVEKSFQKKNVLKGTAVKFFVTTVPSETNKMLVTKYFSFLKSRLSRDKISACREAIRIFFLLCLIFVLQSHSLPAKD